MPNTLTRSTSLKLAVTLLLILIAADNYAAQSPSEQVSIIPEPRQLESTAGVFKIDGQSRLVLADPKSIDDRFAAADFIDDFKAVANVSLRMTKSRGRNSILIGSLKLPSIQAALRKSGFTTPSTLNEEGYLLVADARQVVVAGADAAGVFYGLQTLKQLVKGSGADCYVPGVRIVDWPAMRWRGVSDDISRGPIPTVDYIKRQIRTFAAFKLNLHSFYMEHVFRSESHPLISPAEDALKPDEIRELVKYAHSYHVELVPEQQTFGHLHKALKLEEYGALAETPYGDVLSPQQAGSYQLISDWYRELDGLFPGKFFHIGEDETFELGQGQSREAARVKGVGAVYFEHLNKVRDLLKPYNRRLIFWGDIALNHPDLIGNIPKDMIVANWDYGPKESYISRIKPFSDAGLEQLVCPGVWNWSQIFPNIDSSTRNIINFVRDGQASGATGMLNTSWDDDGEALFEMTWYGVVLGAAASWQAHPVDVNNFDAAFDWAFFRSNGTQFVTAIHALGSVNSLLGVGPTDEIFWRDPFTSSFQVQARTGSEKIRQMRLQVENAEESLLKNRELAKRNVTMIPVMLFAARRFDHLGRRYQTAEKLSREYWDAYLNLGDRTKVRRLRRYAGPIYNQLREMVEELSELKSAYREEWLAENRSYWLESVLTRYDQANSIWFAKSRAIDEALRNYETTSILPSPEQFGLGPRPDAGPTQSPVKR